MLQNEEKFAPLVRIDEAVEDHAARVTDFIARIRNDAIIASDVDQVSVVIDELQGKREMVLNEDAIDDFCAVAAIPPSYGRRLLIDGQADLLVDQLRRRVNDRNERFVRTYRTGAFEDSRVVRALLSTKYKVKDISDGWHVLRAAIDAQFGSNRVMATRWTLNDRTANVQLVDVEDRADARRFLSTQGAVGDDPIFSGWTFSTNEVGHGARAIAAYLYRLICTNGATSSLGSFGIADESHLHRDRLAEFDFGSAMSRWIDRLDAASQDRIVLPEVPVKLRWGMPLDVVPDDVRKQAIATRGTSFTKVDLMTELTALARRHPQRLIIEEAAGDLIADATPLDRIIEVAGVL